LNWVLIVAGLIPLWAALFIVFSNMRVLKDETPVMIPETIQTMPQKPQPQQSLELEILEEPPKEQAPEDKKSLFGGLFGRFKKSSRSTGGL